ncbi:hypothetical protein [Angustibacter sp. Root456]|uniref:hypothetical protein n=1 Tax=Angustibacter sp. Root456 TaxID=1736539 RepID=UPI0006F889B9|nr:hypothetical protein [Angustibacter sp. Root456]KQX61982.1 hypothetical protein ASD06_15755 [Angustibacter sp. Root456]
MTTTTAPRQTSTAARRFGYLVAVGVNVVLLYLINVAPGWQELTFLTSATVSVLTWVNTSLVAGIVANVVYVLDDAPGIRAFGDLVTTSIGLAAIVRVWQVFPFAFDHRGLPWEPVIRVLLVVAGVGSAIAIVVQLVTLVRLAAKGSRP